MAYHSHPNIISTKKKSHAIMVYGAMEIKIFHEDERGQFHALKLAMY
jgi:hypothetical protein